MLNLLRSFSQEVQAELSLVWPNSKSYTLHSSPLCASHFTDVQLYTWCSNQLLKLSSQEERTKELSKMHLIFSWQKKEESPMDLDKKVECST